MSLAMKKAIVTGSFDDLRSADVRFLEEASRQGELHVFLWSDELAQILDGHAPQFSFQERMYVIRSMRYVQQVHPVKEVNGCDCLPPQVERYMGTWVVREESDNYQKRVFCASNGLGYTIIKKALLNQFPDGQDRGSSTPSGRKKVVVTGCFDWFHSGHVRFFEEVSGLGDLYVVVGSDQNVELLKGKGHPMFPQDERRYMVQSIGFVKQAFISSGSGWMDAEPEIDRIRPDIYAVNEDGDHPEKHRFCESNGIRYVVLKRTPKKGLPRRISTDLRGF
jgi:cytidyltransferase-like protein